MNVRDTSIEAYIKIKENGLLSKRRFQVYDRIYHHGPETARQTLDGLNLRSNQTGRFTELEELGMIKEVGKTNCEKTGFTVTLYDVTSKLPVKVKKLNKKEKVTNIKALLVAHLNDIHPMFTDQIEHIIHKIEEI